MMRIITAATLALLLCAGGAWSQDTGFADSKQGILDALSESKGAGLYGYGGGQTPEKKVNLKIEFDVNSAVIRDQSFALLQELSYALDDYRLAGKNFRIIGHTDSDGDAGYNQVLSEKRALSVKNYLVEKLRIHPDRLEASGRGESEPLVPNDSPSNKQQNRRVEIRVAKSAEREAPVGFGGSGGFKGFD